MNKNDQALIFENYVGSVTQGKPSTQAQALIQEAATLQSGNHSKIQHIVENLVTKSTADARLILKSIKDRDPSLLGEMVKDTLDGKYGTGLGPKLETLIENVGKLLQKEKAAKK